MARVTAIALDVMAEPFEWGKSDCCTGACDVFLRLHGVDPMHDLRGRYASRQGALRIIASFGGFVPMVKAFALKLGLREGVAVPGAIGVTNESLLICAAPCAWIGKTEHGMTTVPYAEVLYHAAL